MAGTPNSRALQKVPPTVASRPLHELEIAAATPEDEPHSAITPSTTAAIALPLVPVGVAAGVRGGGSGAMRSSLRGRGVGSGVTGLCGGGGGGGGAAAGWAVTPAAG